MGESENERQYRVIDQMMTMHSILRDRYGRRARLLSIGLLAFAVALNAFVFADDKVLAVLFGSNLDAAKIGLGITSVVLMVLSIIEYRVDWEGLAQSHAEAVQRLGRLKAKYREAFSGSVAGTNPDHASLSQDYARTMEELPHIPEAQFHRLKARHAFKRRLSKEIDDNPGVPVSLLSLRLRARGIWLGLRQKKDNG
jgi:hypothetical protein